MPSRIFLDSADPEHTRELIQLLGKLDGQTTNPSLVARIPHAQERIARGDLFSEEELLSLYRQIVQEASQLLPNGSISVEVYADAHTPADDMVRQAREMFSWIPNAHIKLPITSAGLEAAHALAAEGIRVNMTLCFTQEQAAAVYAATAGAEDVFVSPFVGRLDDRGKNGMDLIKNIIRMYQKGDEHVQVLTASVRSYDHLMYALALGSDIITAPYRILKEWGERGKPLPDPSYQYNAGDKLPIAYRDIDLARDWRTYDISHELTDAGLEKFAHDWNALLKTPDGKHGG